MIKNIIAIICGATLALTISFYTNDNSSDNLRFNIGIYETDTDEKQIEATIELFNRYFATLFNTAGGPSVALNELPAVNMVKRRVVQEIEIWMRNGKVLVYDKDVFEIQSIDLLSPESAVTVARETWFLNVQEKGTRKRMSAVKGNPIKVRYFLRKIEGSWKIIEYEVFGKDDTIPPLTDMRLWL